MVFSSPRDHTLRRTGVVVATLSLMAGATLLAPRAALAFTPLPETTPGYLSLHSEPATLVFSNLSPGTVGYGAVRVSLDDADRADLALQAFGVGSLFEMSGGLSLVVSVCDEMWQGVPASGRVTSADLASGATTEPVCATGGTEVATLGADTGYSTTSLDSGIGSITKGEPRYILVELRMPGITSGNDERLMGQSADFSMRITASGDSPPPDETDTAGEPDPDGETGTGGQPDPGGETDTDGEPGSGGGPGSPETSPLEPTTTVPVATAPVATVPAAGLPAATLPATGVDILGAALCAFGVIVLGLLARRRRPQDQAE